MYRGSRIQGCERHNTACGGEIDKCEEEARTGGREKAERGSGVATTY